MIYDENILFLLHISILIFHDRLKKMQEIVFYVILHACADRIAAIPADCKSAALRASLVRVQLGALAVFS